MRTLTSKQMLFVYALSEHSIKANKKRFQNENAYIDS